MPLTSHPDGIFLSPADFRARFGFAKPGSSSSSSSIKSSSASADLTADSQEGKPPASGKGNADEEVEEVVFYCRAGVRSKTAATLAGGEGGWEGVRVGDLGGGWLEWEAKGGEVER